MALEIGTSSFPERISTRNARMHDTQESLNLAMRLEAGFITLAEVGAWASDAILRAPEQLLPVLSDLLLATSGTTADSHHAHELLCRLGTGASKRDALQHIAVEVLAGINAGALAPADGFHVVWRIADPQRDDLLTPDESDYMDEVSLEILSWPHSLRPWAEIVGSLIPTFLETLIAAQRGAA